MLSFPKRTENAAVIGPVGQLTPYLEPFARAVIMVIIEVETIPIKAPLPDNIPKAAPSVKIIMLTVKDGRTFNLTFEVIILTLLIFYFLRVFNTKPKM